MANGLLGKSMCVTNDFVTPYMVPAAGISYSVPSIQLLNIGNSAANVKVYITTSVTPGNGDMVDMSTLDANGGNLSLSCRCLSPGEKIMVHSSSNLVVARVEGLEEVA